MEIQIKEALLRQESERDTLLSKQYILRETQFFIESNVLENSEIIKVISGPRRSGKSVYGISILKNTNFIYMNFDDQGLIQKNNHNTIYRFINLLYHNSKYIFLDEIQNLYQWEFFVSMLHRNGYNIILTGSNSKLLSKELGSKLTGRYIEERIFPFSFKEYLCVKLGIEYHEIIQLINNGMHNPYNKDLLKILILLNSYLEEGGYPIIVTTNIDYRNYLDTLFNSIIYEDIIKRYSIKSGLLLSNLSKYLVSLFAKEYSYTKLRNILGFKNVNTVKSYVNYLEEAFLIFSLNRYSFKFKEQINSPKKVYIIDNGFISAFYIKSVDLESRLLENQVFLQLLRKNKIPNHTLFYYKTKYGKEVDFVIKDDHSNKVKQLIQVAYSIKDLDTKKREVNALEEASEELRCNNCSIITWDESTVLTGNINIECIPLWLFLLKI